MTKCGSFVNTITILGELQNVATRLTSIVNRINKYVTEILDDNSIEERTILNQVRLIERSSEYMKEQILFVTIKSGNSALSKSTSSRKRAATNLSLKI